MPDRCVGDAQCANSWFAQSPLSQFDGLSKPPRCRRCQWTLIAVVVMHSERELLCWLTNPQSAISQLRNKGN